MMFRRRRSVDTFAHISRHVIAPAWAWWEGSSYLRDARMLRRTQFDRPDVVASRQRHALMAILHHAFETTTFYRRRMLDADIRPTHIEALQDICQLPLLTKADLRVHSEEMRSSAYRDAPVTRKQTSGSTGVSVHVVVDEAAQHFKGACTLRSDEWSGWRKGERVAAIWGNPEYLKHGWRGRLRNRLLQRITFLDTLKMDHAAMERFADQLTARPPSLLFGHAHSLYLFASFCRNRGGVKFRPKAIISTAMVLHDWERQLIEEIFGTPVTNRYGCEEVSLIACQCEQHDGLHVNADGIYLEVLRADGTPCEPGEVGAVVITDLLNRAQPIIRYQVGDMAALSDRQCPCGRGLPLLERIEGRIADYVVTPAGELVSGISLTENFAMLISGIAQLQIVQNAPDRFVFRIVRAADWGPGSERRMAHLVAERFGPDVNYECEFVDRIDPEPSGKYRFCISHVANPFTATVPVA